MFKKKLYMLPVGILVAWGIITVFIRIHQIEMKIEQTTAANSKIKNNYLIYSEVLKIQNEIPDDTIQTVIKFSLEDGEISMNEFLALQIYATNYYKEKLEQNIKGTGKND